MNMKYLALTLSATLSIVSFSVVAKAALIPNGIAFNGISLNGLRVNGIRLNGFNMTATMPRQTGVTLSTLESSSIQVVDGHLVVVK